MLLSSTWKNYLWILTLFLIFCMAACMPSSSTGPQSPPPEALSQQKSEYQPSESNKPRGQVFYLATSGGRLRACPSNDCPVVAVLQKNEEVELLGKTKIQSSFKVLNEQYTSRGTIYTGIPYYWFYVIVKRDGRAGWVDSILLTENPTP
jgi:hypothetical protein